VVDADLERGTLDVIAVEFVFFFFFFEVVAVVASAWSGGTVWIGRRRVVLVGGEDVVRDVGFSC
jgi:hypothetical protein